MKIAMPSMQDMRNSVVSAAGSVKSTFVTTKENGKAQWNGKNVAIATGASTALLTGVAISLRYGTSPAAILAGIKLDANDLGVAGQAAADAISSGAARITSAFTTTFTRANADLAMEKFNAMPGQVQQGFSDLGGVIATGFETVNNNLAGVVKDTKAILEKLAGLEARLSPIAVE